ncbi:MAG: phosphoglucosamine mutase, partial [Candidatus Pacebacteria bacterium]|nr:phosphoglucosamine mutase [Candidatus Paceibacterota bacterium]
LKGPVVGTLMTNLGLELALAEKGIPFKRAKVGDRYVLDILHTEGGTLGGEASGHLLILDKATTGDAIIAALQVLSVMKKTGKSLAELAGGMQKFPQTLLNLEVKERFDPQTVPAIADAVKNAEGILGREGRVVLRASGTEPVIRVMVEAREESIAKTQADAIADAVRGASM